MKKMAQIGTKLYKKEQKKILGGGASIPHPITIDCFDGNMISMTCPSNYHGVVNNQEGSIKCCHYTIDCCYTWSCSGTGLTYQGSACMMLLQSLQQ
jgi:hypothetical protein